VWARVDHVCEPAICSVAMRRFFVLNDLYVENDVRAGGIGRALMQRAHEHARECGAVRVDLETAIDNIVGQSLYESIGYVRDSKFYMYSLDVSKPA
jgi:ribosomal protein S18 acetylase RimI-like enzyme